MHMLYIWNIVMHFPNNSPQMDLFDLCLRKFNFILDFEPEKAYRWSETKSSIRSCSSPSINLLFML